MTESIAALPLIDKHGSFSHCGETVEDGSLVGTAHSAEDGDLTTGFI